jgi:sugar phosphate permease
MLSDLIVHMVNRKPTETNKTNENKKKTPKRKRSAPIKIRLLLVLVYMVLLIVCMHLFNFHLKVDVNQTFLIGIGSVAGFLCYSSLSLLGCMAMEFTPNKYSGTSHAVAALAANLGSIFAGLPFSLLSKYYNWNAAFKLVQILSLFVLSILFMSRNSKPYFETISKIKKTN